MPLINCEIELDLSCLKECIISEISRIARVPLNPVASLVAQEEVPAIQTTAATFEINNTKLYIRVDTLSRNDNIECLENIKQGFRRHISWSKSRSEIAF